jgi:hypothetical protein
VSEDHRGEKEQTKQASRQEGDARATEEQFKRSLTRPINFYRPPIHGDDRKREQFASQLSLWIRNVNYHFRSMADDGSSKSWVEESGLKKRENGGGITANHRHAEVIGSYENHAHGSRSRCVGEALKASSGADLDRWGIR